MVIVLFSVAACGSSSDEEPGELPTRFVPPSQITPETTDVLVELTSEVTPEITPESTEIVAEPTPEPLIQLEVTIEVTSELEPEVTPELRLAETLYDIQIGDLILIEGQLTDPPGDDIDVQLVLVDQIGNVIDVLSSGNYIPPPYFGATVQLPAMVVESTSGEMALSAVALPTVIATPNPDTMLTPQPQPTGLSELRRLLLNPALQGYEVVHFSGNPLAGWSVQLLDPTKTEFVSYTIGTNGGNWSEVPWQFTEVAPQDAIPLDINRVTVDTDEALQNYQDSLIQLQSLTLSLQVVDDRLVWVIDLADGESITIRAE